MNIQLLVMTLICLYSSSLVANEQVAIHQGIKDINSDVYTGIDSLLVYQGNKLIAESYFNGYSKDKLHHTRSSFKSVTGLLAAITFDRDILDPEEPVIPLLHHSYELGKAAPPKMTIRVKDLLHMVSGLDCAEMPGSLGANHEWGIDEGPIPLKYALSIPMVMERGKEWHYTIPS